MLERTSVAPALATGAFDLKWVLVRRILLATILCVAIGAGFVLANVAADARRQNDAASATVATYLRLQMVRSDAVAGLPQRFPDWSTVADFSLQPGQCVKFTSVDGKMNSRCTGVDSATGQAPAWFAAFYEAVFLNAVDTTETFVHRERAKGTIETTSDRGAVALNAWVSVAGMLRLSLVLTAILCGLVYAAVNGALKPTAQILSGLKRLAGGDHTVQLPRYRLRELDSISDGINRLSRELQVATAERAELARKLIDVQEQERRHIARELHDDVAQQLTAISGLAASMTSSLGSDAVAATAAADDLVAASRRAIRSLRETLIYLRPPEIDELGLRTSLDGLIADHNRRSRGAVQFSLTADGPIDGFDAETSAHIYRIIQEGLNNAARHADAKTVSVAIVHTGVEALADGRQGDAIELRIEDDGSGWSEAAAVPEGRFGLLGMRERVAALDGKLSMDRSARGGASLIVRFCVQRAGG